MSAPDALSGGLDEIPSFGNPEHEAATDAQAAAAVRTATVDNDRAQKAWDNYQDALSLRSRAAAERRLGREVGPASYASIAGLVSDTPPVPSAASSVSVEDMSKGDPKITTKVYADSLLTVAIIDAALDAHGYAHRLAAAMALDGWQKTVAETKGETL